LTTPLARALDRALETAPFHPKSTEWDGLADFAQVVDEVQSSHTARNVSWGGVLDYAALKPEDALLLIHPETEPDVESLSRFLREGGRVLLLDDYGAGDVVLRHFGMERIAAPYQPAEMLRHKPDLPLAEPAGAHPTVADVGRVALNHPTALKHPDLSPILKIRERGDPNGAGAVVAAAGAVRKGRLLVVSDASILINEMMRYPGNRAFARALVQYALDDDTWGKRGGHLYVFSGRFEQRGQFGEEETWLTQLRDRLRDLGSELRNVRDNGMPSGVSYALAIMLGLGLVVWVGKRAGRVHKTSPPRYTRPVPLLAQGGVAGRIALLASPHTSRLLGILEWKSVLEEEFVDLLGLESLPSHDRFLSEVTRRGLLETAELAQLRKLLLTFAQADTLLLAQQSAGAGGERRLPMVRIPGGRESHKNAGLASGLASGMPSGMPAIADIGEAVKKLVNSARSRATTGDP
jgi:hypothetical protein